MDDIAKLLTDTTVCRTCGPSNVILVPLHHSKFHLLFAYQRNCSTVIGLAVVSCGITLRHYQSSRRPVGNTRRDCHAVPFDLPACFYVTIRRDDSSTRMVEIQTFDQRRELPGLVPCARRRDAKNVLRENVGRSGAPGVQETGESIDSRRPIRMNVFPRCPGIVLILCHHGRPEVIQLGSCSHSDWQYGRCFIALD